MIFGDSEDSHAGGETGEFGGDVAEVGEAENDHGEEGHAQAELFADEVGKSFAGDGAHAGGHLLNDDEGDGGGHQGPEERIAVLGACLRVGEDAAGVVIDIGGDEAGTDDREKREQAVAHQLPRVQRGMARTNGTVRTRLRWFDRGFHFLADPSMCRRME